MDRYVPGVPCWVDTSQPDPVAAADFYGGLFGWELEDVMPPEAGAKYLVGRIDGQDAAAIGERGADASGPVAWETYVWTDSADAVAQRVRDAGGSVRAEPFDVPGAGRSAVLADPDGAQFSVWEPREHRGATVVNQHGAVVFNDLHAADVERAQAFYGAVFGWTTIPMGPGAWMWTQSSYGDLLEQLNPGTRARNAEMGAPEGFENVVASLQAAGDGEPARWSVTFAVDDADAAAARAAELGGTVDEAPNDQPWVRQTTITDPQGATFVASQFKPENA